MINNKAELKECLQYERRLYGNRKTNSFIPRFSEQGLIWKYILLLRKSEYYLNTHKKIRYLLTKTRFKKLGFRLGFSIPLNAVDKGLLIYHRGNLILNCKHIGKNCSLAGTAFFVAKGQTGEAPTLGDNISVGMNVTIVGGVKLASMIAIGAGSVVTKSFLQENITIAGNPAKIINQNQGSASWGGWIKHFGDDQSLGQ